MKNIRILAMTAVLSLTIISNQSFSMQQNEAEKCSICLEDLNTIGTITLPCMHTLHAHCINEWFSNQPYPNYSCPNCRYNLDYVNEFLPTQENIKRIMTIYIKKLVAQREDTTDQITVLRENAVLSLRENCQSLYDNWKELQLHLFDLEKDNIRLIKILETPPAMRHRHVKKYCGKNKDLPPTAELKAELTREICELERSKHEKNDAMERRIGGLSSYSHADLKKHYQFLKQEISRLLTEIETTRQKNKKLYQSMTARRVSTCSLMIKHLKKEHEAQIQRLDGDPQSQAYTSLKEKCLLEWEHRQGIIVKYEEVQNKYRELGSREEQDSLKSRLMDLKERFMHEFEAMIDNAFTYDELERMLRSIEEEKMPLIREMIKFTGICIQRKKRARSTNAKI